MKKMALIAILAVSIDMLGPLASAESPAPLVTQTVNDEGEKLLADSIGKTLYVFDVDQGSTTSKCDGACAEVWPPFLLSVDEVSQLKAPFASLLRASKMAQLTYNGRPVYTYIYDRVSGDDKGDGLHGVWHYIELPKTN